MPQSLDGSNKQDSGSAFLNEHVHRYAFSENMLFVLWTSAHTTYTHMHHAYQMNYAVMLCFIICIHFKH
jgi:hypothetical protein